MLDLGWPEMLVIAIVLIVVVGPKDLPKMLRAFGRMTSKVSAMAGDFRKQFDEALKEAELDEVRNLANDARKLNPASELKKALNPMEKAARDVRAGLDDMMKSKPRDVPAPDAPAAPAEPAKAGPAALPGEGAAPKPAPRPAPAAPPYVPKTATKPAAAAGAAPKPARSAPAAKKPGATAPAAKKPGATAPAAKKPAARTRKAKADGATS